MLATSCLVLLQMYFLKYSLKLHIFKCILNHILESLSQVVLFTSVVTIATIATIATIKNQASFSSNIVLLLHYGSGLSLVLLLCHAGTTSNQFKGGCFVLDLDVDLWRSYSKLTEKLDSPVYFRSWVTKWT